MAEGKSDGGGPALRWDAWGEAREAIFASRLGTKGGGTRLVAVVFAHRWNPAALHVASLFEQLRAKPDYMYVSIFLVDADKEQDVCHEHGVHATPAVVLFWDGDPMPVRRPGWNDDQKFVGALAPDDVRHMVSYARDAGERSLPRLHLSF